MSVIKKTQGNMPDQELILAKRQVLTRIEELILFLTMRWQKVMVGNVERFPKIKEYRNSYYSPALEKWGYTGFTLSFRDSVIPWFCGSMVPSFREHFVSAQYLKNKLTESDQILYAHQH